jgi:hypothetical protein
MSDHCPVTGWKFSDAWFATAVAIQDTPCNLTDVIAAGDALDHAIFTHEEIQQACADCSAPACCGSPTMGSSA